MKVKRWAGISIFSLLGLMLAAACGFFAFYTLRLLYIKLAVPAVAQHRQFGMYIGMVAFPIATLGFGWSAFRCVRTVARAVRRSKSDAESE